MAGAINDYLIYPIIDLIRSEIRRNNLSRSSTTPLVEGEGDPFSGTPSVALYREHPLDADRVTGIRMVYPTLYIIDIDFMLGSEDESTWAQGVTRSTPEHEYYAIWRLTALIVSALDPNEHVLGSYNIRLHYDGRGLLTGTEVSRLD